MTTRIALAAATLLALAPAAALADEADFLAIAPTYREVPYAQPQQRPQPQPRDYSTGFSGAFGAAQTAHVLGY